MQHYIESNSDPERRIFEFFSHKNQVLLLKIGSGQDLDRIQSP